MPLSEKSLSLLNDLKSISLQPIGAKQDELIKEAFKKILSSGNTYKISDIEDWLDNNPQTDSLISERILNIAHYQKAKFDARNPLKMVHDSCGCGGDC
jgi:hypothetical protein